MPWLRLRHRCDAGDAAGIQAIGTNLYTSDYHRSGRLRWGKPGDGYGYGYPVPKNIRNLLVGNDAAYEG